MQAPKLNLYAVCKVFASKQSRSLPAFVDPERVRVAVTASSTLPATPLMTAHTSIDGVPSDTTSVEFCILISAFIATV